MIVVFNKTDVEPCDERIEWMRDFEAFQQALRKEEEASDGSGSGYMNSLMNSMSLVLEEFYNHLDVVGVSSMTGDGFDEYLDCLERKRTEYWNDYRPELEAMKAQRDQTEDARQKAEFQKLNDDLNKEAAAETVSEAEAESEAGSIEPDEVEDYETVERHPSDPVGMDKIAEMMNRI